MPIRRYYLQVEMEPSIKQRLRKVAQWEGLSLSAWVRRVLLQAARRVERQMAEEVC